MSAIQNCVPNKSRSKSKGKLKSGRRPRSDQIPALSPISPLLRYNYGVSIRPGNQALYDVKFNLTLMPGQPLIFATAGGNEIRIYECEPSGGIKFLTAFRDPDTENFYVCAWTSDVHHKPLLAAAGLKGIIRIFELASGNELPHFEGHTQAINDLKFHPKEPNLLFSGSKDHSIRLWNLKTHTLVAIFHGEEGHRDEIITIDVGLSGGRLASGGMDHSVKVWDLDIPELTSAIRESYRYKVSNKKIVRPFPTFRQQLPMYSTRDVHFNYVDCVKWFGNFMISKACTAEDERNGNSVVIWKAGKPLQSWDTITFSETRASVIANLHVKDCQCWFMRFCMDSQNRVLALGNEVGRIFVYDFTTQDPTRMEKHELIHWNCTTAIRQTAFSRDGSILIGVCDDGSIWRWNNAFFANNPTNSIIN